MAKRKSHKKSYTRRRRHAKRGVLGAIGKIDMMAPVAMIGGAVLGRWAVNKFLSNQNGTIKGAAQIGVGIVAQTFGKNALLHNAGTGMVAAGGLTLIQSVMPNLAIGAEGDSEILIVSGTDDISTVNGVDQIGADATMDEINTVNGIDEDYDY